MRALADFLRGNEAWALGLTLTSIGMFVGTILLLPWLVARAPRDHFVRSHRPVTARQWTRALVRNLLGIVCIVSGLAMLVLPGQGLLTLLIGISLTDFPGKHALAGRLVRHEQVQRSLSWLRRRAGKEPFDVP